MSEDKPPEELFKAVTTDPKILELLREVRDMLEEHGLEKDDAIDYVIGVLVAGYNNLDHLIVTLDSIKLSYLMPTVQPMIHPSNIVDEDPEESAFKPV